ncbi:MAG: hypothetical protein LC647_01680 [Beggiatoa sp.]|nr:hypothetical protein [Beggiatoa sp.]
MTRPGNTPTTKAKGTPSITIKVSPADCYGQTAVRLGLHGQGPLAGRRRAARRGPRFPPFSDVHDLNRRARLNRKDLDALAAANALRSLAGHRHRTRWAVLGIEAPRPCSSIPAPMRRSLCCGLPPRARRSWPITGASA